MSKIKGLGEVALRVTDLDKMQNFYENVVGLKLMQRFEDSAFFSIAEGYGGHTQILAMFDRSAIEGFHGIKKGESSLDHLAFEIDLDDYYAEKERLENSGIDFYLKEFEWVHWRSIFFNDPEGNLVELVCYDESVG